MSTDTKFCEWCGDPISRDAKGANYKRARFCNLSCSASSTASKRVGSRNSNWRGGAAAHPLYLVYSAMLKRCRNPKDPRYQDYGGRGIRVHQEWVDDFWAFVRDVGDRPEGVGPSGRALWSIDRIDNDGDYEPGNVRWSTPSQQRANRRSQRSFRVQDGALNSMAKITEGDVREIRASPLTGSQLSERYGVSVSNIYMIRSGRTWRHVD